MIKISWIIIPPKRFIKIGKSFIINHRLSFDCSVREGDSKLEDRTLDFNDFQKQEIKFDIEKLQEAYHQIVKIKKFEDAGVTNFGAIS